LLLLFYSFGTFHILNLTTTANQPVTLKVKKRIKENKFLLT
jgi:hypothetical protein